MGINFANLKLMIDESNLIHNFNQELYATVSFCSGAHLRYFTSYLVILKFTHIDRIHH